MVIQRVGLVDKVLSLAIAARSLGPENCAGMLITGYLRQAETQGLISSDEVKEISDIWKELRQQIEGQKRRGITDATIEKLGDRLRNLQHAA